MTQETIMLGELIKNLASAYNKLGDVPVVFEYARDKAPAPIVQVGVGYPNDSGQLFCCLAAYYIKTCPGCERCKKGSAH